MKLTNLNCPQCNGFLNQQGESFFCSSCGTAFTIDYDEADVKYTDLVTQADRTRQLLARDLEVMQTQYQLREDMAQRQERREWVNERKKDLRTIFRITLSYIVVGVISVGLMVGGLFYIFSGVRKSTSDQKVRSAESVSKIVEILKNRKDYLDNADLTAQYYVTTRQYENVNDENYLSTRDARRTAEAELVDAYLMQSTTANDTALYLIYKTIYTYTDTQEEVPVYDCVRFLNFDLDKNGALKTDYIPDFGNQSSGTFGGYREFDQLYRQCILGSYRLYATKLDISYMLSEGGAKG